MRLLEDSGFRAAGGISGTRTEELGSPRPGRSELELHLESEALRPVREELAERQRAPLRHHQRAHALRGAGRAPLQASFEAAAQAPARRLQLGEEAAEQGT